jgi:hypothetical protein
VNRQTVWVCVLAAVGLGVLALWLVARATRRAAHGGPEVVDPGQSPDAAGSVCLPPAQFLHRIHPPNLVATPYSCLNWGGGVCA